MSRFASVVVAVWVVCLLGCACVAFYSLAAARRVLAAARAAAIPARRPVVISIPPVALLAPIPARRPVVISIPPVAPSAPIAKPAPNRLPERSRGIDISE